MLLLLNCQILRRILYWSCRLYHPMVRRAWGGGYHKITYSDTHLTFEMLKYQVYNLEILALEDIIFKPQYMANLFTQMYVLITQSISVGVLIGELHNFAFWKVAGLLRHKLYFLGLHSLHDHQLEEY